MHTDNASTCRTIAIAMDEVTTIPSDSSVDALIAAISKVPCVIRVMPTGNTGMDKHGKPMLMLVVRKHREGTWETMTPLITAAIESCWASAPETSPSTTEEDPGMVDGYYFGDDPAALLSGYHKS